MFSASTDDVGNRALRPARPLRYFRGCSTPAVAIVSNRNRRHARQSPCPDRKSPSISAASSATRVRWRSGARRPASMFTGLQRACAACRRWRAPCCAAVWSDWRNRASRTSAACATAASPRRSCCLRSPPISRVEEVVRSVDISLQSELAIIRELSRIAERMGRVHDIMLMVDLGDLREGIWPNELLPTVEQILDMKGVRIAGIGTNLGCFGAIMPTRRQSRATGRACLQDRKAGGHQPRFRVGRRLVLAAIASRWHAAFRHQQSEGRRGDPAGRHRDLSRQAVGGAGVRRLPAYRGRDRGEEEAVAADRPVRLRRLRQPALFSGRGRPAARHRQYRPRGRDGRGADADRQGCAGARRVKRSSADGRYRRRSADRGRRPGRLPHELRGHASGDDLRVCREGTDARRRNRATAAHGADRRRPPGRGRVGETGRRRPAGGDGVRRRRTRRRRAAACRIDEALGRRGQANRACWRSPQRCRRRIRSA